MNDKHEIENNQTKMVARQVTLSSGPLPPPSILESYNKIVPGAAERIIKIAEEQSSHRRSLEAMVIKSDIENTKLGLKFGLCIGLFGLVATTAIAIWGNPILSGIIGFATLGSLVGVFVYGSQQRRHEREESKKGHNS